MRASTPSGGQELEGKLLLTVDEAAQRLGIGRSHAYIYVLRGEIESVKIGRSRRIPAEALDAFVERLRSDQVEAS